MKQPYVEEFRYGEAKATVLHTFETYPSQEARIRNLVANWFAEKYQAKCIISVSTGHRQAQWSVCWHSKTYQEKEQKMKYWDRQGEKKERAAAFLKAFEDFLQECPPNEEEIKEMEAKYSKSVPLHKKFCEKI